MAGAVIRNVGVSDSDEEKPKNDFAHRAAVAFLMRSCGRKKPGAASGGGRTRGKSKSGVLSRFVRVKITEESTGIAEKFGR